MRRVLVLTEQDPLNRIRGYKGAPQDAVATGFWSSEDSLSAILGDVTKEALSLNQTVKAYPEYVEKAYSLAHPIAEKSPLYRGIRPLLAWEEVLADSILKYLVIGDFHRALFDRYGSGAEVVFFAPCEFQQFFSLWDRERNSSFRVRLLSPLEPGRWRQKSLDHLKGFRNAAQDAKQERHWKQVFWAPVEVLDDRYRVRSSLWPRARFERGGRWFYGSYVNYARILRRHQDRLKSHATWVVNQKAASRGLQDDDYVCYLWQFGRPAKTREHEHYLHETREYISSLDREWNGFNLREFIRSSREVSYLLNRILPSGLSEIDLMEAMLEKGASQELWVANQWGSEGELTLLANSKGIPVTQVQHGALHRYFAVSPIMSKRFLVWGPFWQNRLRAGEGEKSEVFNPGLDIVPVERKKNKPRGKRITFLTTPLNLGLFWNADATLQDVGALAKHLMARGHTLLMRIHPSDRIEFWRHALKGVIGSIPPELRFSKEESLPSVLEETDLAIMFFSTVFLNCVASGIPVIGLGWYPHIWQKPLEKMGVVQFAKSMEEALDLVETFNGVPGPHYLTDQFLAAPSC